MIRPQFTVLCQIVETHMVSRGLSRPSPRGTCWPRENRWFSGTAREIPHAIKSPVHCGGCSDRSYLLVPRTDLDSEALLVRPARTSTFLPLINHVRWRVFASQCDAANETSFFSLTERSTILSGLLYFPVDAFLSYFMLSPIFILTRLRVTFSISSESLERNVVRINIIAE